MAAVAQQQVGAPLERGRQVHARSAPARCPDDLAELRADHGRSPAVVAEARGDEPDDADRPRPAHDRRPGVAGADRRPRLRDRLLVRSRRVRLAASSTSASASASAASSVSSSRAASIASPTRPAAFSRGASAKPTVSRSSGPFDAARARRAASPARGAVRRRSSPRRAIERFSPTIGAMSETVPMVARSASSRARGRPARLVVEQQLGHLEGDAGPRQAAIGVVGVGAVRVHQGDRRRPLLGHAVMVGDQHVDAAGGRGGDLGHARRAGVDGDDEADPGARRRLDGRQREAMALVQARRDVRDHRDAERPERDREDRQPGQAIRVEVAEDHDRLGGPASGGDAVDEPLGVGQAARIVEARFRLGQEGGEVGGGLDAAGGQDLGRPGAQARAGGGRQERRRGRHRVARGPSGSEARSRPQDASPGCTAPKRSARDRPVTTRCAAAGGRWAGVPSGGLPSSARRRGAGWH